MTDYLVCLILGAACLATALHLAISRPARAARNARKLDRYAADWQTNVVPLRRRAG